MCILLREISFLKSSFKKFINDIYFYYLVKDVHISSVSLKQRIDLTAVQANIDVFLLGKSWTSLLYMCVCLVAQSSPILETPIDFSLSGSSVHGILQARILEWVAIPFSRVNKQGTYLWGLSCTAVNWPPCPLNYLDLFWPQ